MATNEAKSGITCIACSSAKAPHRLHHTCWAVGRDLHIQPKIQQPVDITAMQKDRKKPTPTNWQQLRNM